MTTCPDGGTCHHYCDSRCFRVSHAGPLSIANYPDNRWPYDVVAEHAPDRLPDWEAFLVDQDGFTFRNDARVLEILAIIGDDDALDRLVGDSPPMKIVVVRGDAKPTPASDFLRMPSRWPTADRIDIADDLCDIFDPARARLLWLAAKGAASGMNAAEA